ncbi:MAG: lipoprotein, partial [Planctomycetota bacterium]
VMLKADSKREGEAPAEPSPEQQQKVITAALEKAYAEIPDREGIVDFAKKSMKMTTEFVRKRDLVTIPPDPLEIILMPEFQRGVSIAYCDSPGPLDVGQKTYYAVSPIPDDWTEKQVGSFLREYNFRSIHDLTIHEAMPGHFLQIAHSNRSPRRLRALLSSGTFVEGWGVYSEQLMSEEGFLDRDPLMRLIALKWYLRGVANSILDQAIHVDGMNREEAMKLMVHDTFQEEREAALKWIRAQLTSTQLSTYFVGYQEHRDLRTAAEKAWADKFTLKRYHDGTLSFGSPPVRFVKALLLDEPIPE